MVTRNTEWAARIFSISDSGVRITSGSTRHLAAFGNITRQSVPYMCCGSIVDKNTGFCASTSARRLRWKATSLASDSNVLTMDLGLDVEPDVWNVTEKRRLRIGFSTANVPETTMAERRTGAMKRQRPAGRKVTRASESAAFATRTKSHIHVSLRQ